MKLLNCLPPQKEKIEDAVNMPVYGLVKRDEIQNKIEHIDKNNIEFFNYFNELIKVLVEQKLALKNIIFEDDMEVYKYLPSPEKILVIWEKDSEWLNIIAFPSSFYKIKNTNMFKQ